MVSQFKKWTGRTEWQAWLNCSLLARLHTATGNTDHRFKHKNSAYLPRSVDSISPPLPDKHHLGGVLRSGSPWYWTKTEPSHQNVLTVSSFLMSLGTVHFLSEPALSDLQHVRLSPVVHPLCKHRQRTWSLLAKLLLCACRILSVMVRIWRIFEVCWLIATPATRKQHWRICRNPRWRRVVTEFHQSTCSAWCRKNQMAWTIIMGWQTRWAHIDCRSV